MNTKRHLVMVAVLMNMLVAVTVNAAGVPQTLEEIKAGIADSKAGIADLQTSVDNIIAPDQSNVRFSPPIEISYPHFLFCQVVNVTNVNQKVQVDQLKHDGSVAATFTFDPLLPGRASGTGAQGTQGLTAPRWCRFIVIDGSRTAIRASIQLEESSASPLLILSAE